MMNKDDKVIEGFGEEWNSYKYDEAEKEKTYESFQQYFSIFPWDRISETSEGFDMGCGSGRWAQFVAPKVGRLNCVEPSKAFDVAKANLGSLGNVMFLQETTDTCSLPSESQDFGYCLGVLHHIPDTEAALKDCARLLKPGAPFLLYLYYSFENKPWWFKAIWKVSDIFRRGISALSYRPRKLVCETIATVIYLPLARSAWLMERLGLDVGNMPLSDYRTKPFYQMRNDALDRFGTRLEQRFSRAQILRMLENSGLGDVKFSDETPYWCCISYKR